MSRPLGDFEVGCLAFLVLFPPFVGAVVTLVLALRALTLRRAGAIALVIFTLLVTLGWVTMFAWRYKEEIALQHDIDQTAKQALRLVCQAEALFHKDNGRYGNFSELAKANVLDRNYRDKDMGPVRIPYIENISLTLLFSEPPTVNSYEISISTLDYLPTMRINATGEIWEVRE